MRTRRDLLELLAKIPLFADMDSSSLSDLGDVMQRFTLRGGTSLFTQGGSSDALFVLLYGRLAAMRHGSDGHSHVLGYIVPGECVGETGMITRQTHSASVIAVRDSELLRLPRAMFEKLLTKHPSAMMTLARTALRRSSGSQHGAPASTQCYALLAMSDGLDLRDFAARLARALGTDPHMAMVEANQAEGRDPGWFSARESHCEHLIYIDNDDPDWRDRCLRQSDCVLLVGDAGQDYDPHRSNPHQELSSSTVQHLILMQKNELPAGRTRTWLAACPGVNAHHHVRNDADIARLGRRLTGKANGLVLSGGGARGFAHLGVIRALREANMPIDYIGGTSIGAIIGAGLASDWTDAHMLEVYRRCFIDNDPISDWTVPLVSLRAGRKASNMLREAFGERDIEDLPIPFFAVSSNLTEGGLHVHEIDKLWIALRASSALPGVLPPVFANGQVLVDGGVIDNLPVGEMRKRMSGEIIAVDIGGGYRLEAMIEETELPPWWQLIPELFRKKKRPSLGQILLRSGMVNSLATAQRRRKQTKLLLKPDLPGVDLLTWKEFHRAIDLGYQHARGRLEARQDDNNAIDMTPDE